MRALRAEAVYAAGYDIAAAACGDNFLPAGFTEFAGWSDSAKQVLRFITHKGDCLKADEEGERFDAGAEATWATRKHRSFMIHTVAAAAARATYMYHSTTHIAHAQQPLVCIP